MNTMEVRDLLSASPARTPPRPSSPHSKDEPRIGTMKEPLKRVHDENQGINTPQGKVSSLHNEKEIDPRSKDKTKRARAHTYTRRKQEKMELQNKIERLQMQVKSLKTKERRRKEEEIVALKKELGAEFVRGALNMQQMPLVNVHSALNGVMYHLPEFLKIHLGRDHEERRVVLKEIKPTMMQQALEYLAERERFVDPTQPHAGISRFIDPEGDYCALLFDVVPFEGIQTVKEVYDALAFYYSDMEIRVTEALGDVTIREDDGNSESDSEQCRFLSYLSNGTQLETNNIISSQYDEINAEFGEGRPLGVFTENFVEQDDLYPYLQSQRLRQDVSVVVRVKSYAQTRILPDGTETQEYIVVLTRCGHVKLHKTSISLPPAVVHELREGVAQWGDVMLKAVRELVYHPGRPFDINAIAHFKSKNVEV